MTALPPSPEDPFSALRRRNRNVAFILAGIAAALLAGVIGLVVLIHCAGGKTP